VKLMITPEGDDAHQAADWELAGSPHRQIFHVLVALPVGSTILLEVPEQPSTSYHSVAD
jgi:hypothetical protein